MIPKEQYEIWDKQGFNGDENIHTMIKQLCVRHRITSIVETGTRYGNTTKRLAALANTVSCELDELNYNIAKENLMNKEKDNEPIALVFNCSSVDFMKLNLKKMDNQRILFYLDAHGNKGTPLLEELDAIAEAGIKPVICIHDFVVPERPELGFDTYNGQAYTWEWIESRIRKIYGEDFIRQYNDEAAGAMRGIIYIEPAQPMEVKKRTAEERKAHAEASLKLGESESADANFNYNGVSELSVADPSTGSMQLESEAETPKAGMIDKTKRKK